MCFVRVVTACAIALAFSSPAIAATLLFSNLGESQDDGSGIGQTAHRPANEFLTGNSAATITDLSIRVANYDTIAHTFSAFLYSDSSNSPGTLLATFSPVDNSVSQSPSPGVTGALKVVTFSHSGISVAANTQYWIAMSLLENAQSHSVAWVETNSSDEDAGSIFTNDAPPNRYISIDSGASWLLGPERNGQFSLDGNIVPEPNGLLLFVIGSIGLSLKANVLRVARFKSQNH